MKRGWSLRTATLTWPSKLLVTSHRKMHQYPTIRNQWTWKKTLLKPSRKCSLLITKDLIRQMKSSKRIWMEVSLVAIRPNITAVMKETTCEIMMIKLRYPRLKANMRGRKGANIRTSSQRSTKMRIHWERTTLKISTRKGRVTTLLRSWRLTRMTSGNWKNSSAPRGLRTHSRILILSRRKSTLQLEFPIEVRVRMTYLDTELKRPSRRISWLNTTTSSFLRQ